MVFGVQVPSSETSTVCEENEREEFARVGRVIDADGDVCIDSFVACKTYWKTKLVLGRTKWLIFRSDLRVVIPGSVSGNNRAMAVHNLLKAATVSSVEPGNIGLSPT